MPDTAPRCFARVVVDFTGGSVRLADPNLVSSNRLFSAGCAAVTVTRGGVRTRARAINAHGVRAHITQRSGHITIAVSGGAHRFKALAESVLSSPSRLALDLWKAAPPSVAATGHVLRALFENTFTVQVRGASGALLGHKTVTAPVGSWHRSVAYHVSHSQRGTFEAASFSARDGSLECLAQVPVTLAP